MDEDLTASLNEQVNLLATMVGEFANTLDVDDTLMRALKEITDYLDAEGGAVFLLDEDVGIITCVACYGATEITGLQMASGQGIVGKSVQQNIGLMVRDVQNDPDFYSAVDDQTGYTTRSILCAPLSVNDKCVGAVELVNRRGSETLFSQTDLKVLETLASAAALAVINARMAKALVEQERVKKELELAAEIQRRFLPQEDKSATPLPVMGVNRAARGVSGDFFDYFKLPDGRIYFALGDVSGKGINAALLMSKTASLFHCLGKKIRDPGRLLGVINTELCETSAHGMFVTMVAGIYDPRPGCQGLIRLANAGHEPVLLYNEDGFETFGADGPPLGIVPPFDGEEGAYDEVQIFPKGGSIYIYTDGLTEGYLSNGMTLEVSGIKDILQTYKQENLSTHLDHLVRAVSQDGQPLRDDVTVLALSDAGRPQDNANIKESEASFGIDELSEGQCLIDFRFPAKPTWMKLARSCVREVCVKMNCTDQLTTDLVLALDEACQNVIRHAYGGPSEEEILLTVRQRPNCLVFRLQDFAPTVAPDTIKSRDLDDIRPGGLGTHLIKEVMDDVQYLRPSQGEGNVLRLVKYLNQNDIETQK